MIPKTSDYIIAGGIFLIIGYIAKLCLTGETATAPISPSHTIISFVCCFVVAISVSINNIQTKKLSSTGFSPLDILAIRFILLITVSGLIVFFQHHAANIIQLFFNKDMILITCTMVIVPLPLLQIGIRELEPFTIAIITPFTPVLAYFFEFFDHRLTVTINTFYAIIAILFFVLIGTFLRYRNESTIPTQNIPENEPSK